MVDPQIEQVTLTDAAARHIQKAILKRGRGIGIRLGVKTTGCSGMAYALEFADKKDAHDLVFEHQGVCVIIDPKSIPYLAGTQIDFVREGLQEGFKFVNPNVKDHCGCGESFTV